MRKELEFLINTIKQAGEMVDEHCKVSLKTNPDKGFDLVTEADLKVESFLIDKIKSVFPDYRVISEEYNSDVTLADNCFIIDPIDGTINFAKGNPIWAIQAACITKGKTVASVIYVPKLNELFYAEKGKGAYLNGKRIKVSNRSINESDIFVASRFKEPFHIYALTKLMEVVGTRNPGSGAYCFAYAAAGRFDGGAMLHYALWDVIPGIFLAQEAGGFVYDKKGEYVLVSNSQKNLEILKSKVKEADKKSVYLN